MKLSRILLVWSVWLLSLAIVGVGAQFEEETLVASSPFRMAVSPTASSLLQGTLELIRATAVAELKEAQSNSDLPYLLSKTKVVLQGAELQGGEDLTIIRFFALATQKTTSVPPGTAFRDVRTRAAETRQAALNELVESATGSSRFVERLQEEANAALESGDGRVSVEAVSQILAIDSIAVAPVASPNTVVDGSDDSSKALSTADIILIVVIIVIFLAIVLIAIQFRRDRKAARGGAAESTGAADISAMENNRPISPDYQIGATPVIDEEAASPTSDEESPEDEDDNKVDSSAKEATYESESSSSASASKTSGSAASTGTSGGSTKSERDASSASTPSLCSEADSSKTSGVRSIDSHKSASDGIKASLYYSSSNGALQSLSLSQSDSAAYLDDDVSDVVAELLKTTKIPLTGTVSSTNDILAETQPPKSELSPPDNSPTNEIDENLSSAESLETFTSNFFGSSNDSTPKGKNRRAEFANEAQGNINGGGGSSSSSYYSSSGSTSSEDLFQVDIESASSKKSSSVDRKHSSPAAIGEWMKTIQVVSGSRSSTDSKTTASSHDRTSISSLTAPSMATSVGVSSLELSLGRLDRRRAKSAIDEEEECAEV